MLNVAEIGLVENIMAPAAVPFESRKLTVAVAIANPEKMKKRGGILGAKRGKYGKDSRVTKWRQRV